MYLFTSCCNIYYQTEFCNPRFHRGSLSIKNGEIGGTPGLLSIWSKPHCNSKLLQDELTGTRRSVFQILLQKYCHKMERAFSENMLTSNLLLIIILFAPPCIYSQTTDPRFKTVERKRFYSIYRRAQTRILVDEIINFNQNLKFAPRCLVHVINFEGLDLPMFQNHERPPIVLSRFDAVTVWFGYKLSATFVLPFEKVPLQHPLNLTFGEWLDMNMFLSPNFTYKNLMLRSHPWTCEVHAYLLPPLRHVDRAISRGIHPSYLVDKRFPRIFLYLLSSTRGMACAILSYI